MAQREAPGYLSSHPTLKSAIKTSKIEWLAELLQPVLPRHKDARILEIGPGRGEALEYLVARGYQSIEGIDNSPEVIEACRAIAGTSVSLVTDATQFFADSPHKYDLVIMYHVLEHIDTVAVEPMLRSILDALSDTGVLMIGVPNAAAPIIGADQQYFDFTHRTAFSPWSLEQVMRMAGFKTVDVMPVWPPGRSVGRIVQRGIQKALLACVRVYLKAFTGTPRPVLTHSIVAYGRR